MQEKGWTMREPRTPMRGTVIYTHDPEEQGKAQWVNVSRVGAHIRLERYLRPGRRLWLEISTSESGEPCPVEARVMWCRQRAGELGFEAGVRIRRETPETALAFATLAHEARRQAPKRWTHLESGSHNLQQPAAEPALEAV